MSGLRVRQARNGRQGQAVVGKAGGDVRHADLGAEGGDILLGRGDLTLRDRSLPSRQEVGDAGLVDLVADRAHVIAVRNIEHLGARNDFPERRG